MKMLLEPFVHFPDEAIENDVKHGIETVYVGCACYSIISLDSIFTDTAEFFYRASGGLFL